MDSLVSLLDSFVQIQDRLANAVSLSVVLSLMTFIIMVFVVWSIFYTSKELKKEIAKNRGKIRPRRVKDISGLDAIPRDVDGLDLLFVAYDPRGMIDVFYGNEEKNKMLVAHYLVSYEGVILFPDAGSGVITLGKNKGVGDWVINFYRKFYKGAYNNISEFWSPDPPHPLVEKAISYCIPQNDETIIEYADGQVEKVKLEKDEVSE